MKSRARASLALAVPVASSRDAVRRRQVVPELDHVLVDDAVLAIVGEEAGLDEIHDEAAVGEAVDPQRQLVLPSRLLDGDVAVDLARPEAQAAEFGPSGLQRRVAKGCHGVGADAQHLALVGREHVHEGATANCGVEVRLQPLAPSLRAHRVIRREDALVRRLAAVHRLDGSHRRLARAALLLQLVHRLVARDLPAGTVKARKPRLPSLQRLRIRLVDVAVVVLCHLPEVLDGDDFRS